MFRALSQGFTDHSEFATSQTSLFTQKEAALYPTTQIDPSLLDSTTKGLGVWDPNTRQLTKKNVELKKYFAPMVINDNLVQQNQQCVASDIDTLIGSQSLTAKVRCGWIYQKGKPGSQPVVSQGCLGTRAGPVAAFNQPKGTYYWNLDDAKKQIMKDRCGALVGCANVESDEFKGCAYSTTRGVGVPVDSAGGLMYPRDAALSAPASSLVRKANACPAPPPANSPQYASQQSRDSCTPLPNGNLSRDCMLQQITAAGCKQDGALYQSLLNSTQPTNYGAELTGLTSYKKYQQLANMPLLETIVRDGSTTKDIAMQNFKELHRQSGTVNTTALSFASRDLCLKKGTMDSYNFCNELNDASSAPFDLGCLQEAFRKAGGQPTGAKYPIAENKTTYDAMRTWGAVKRYFAQLAANALAPGDTFIDASAQRRALIDFLGIARDPIDNTYIAGDLQQPGQFLDSGGATQRFRLWINKNLAPGKPATFLSEAYTSVSSGTAMQITVVRNKDGNSRTFPITSFDDGGSYWQIESTGKDAYQYGQFYITGDEVTFSFDIYNPPGVRFVRIGDGSDGRDGWLQLSQVVVKDMNGTNIAKGKPVNATPDAPNSTWGTSAKMVVDGVEEARPIPLGYHSNTPNHPFWEVDLTTPAQLSSVVIYQQSSGAFFRMSTGMKVSLLDYNKNVLAQLPITSSALVQTYAIGGTATAPTISMVVNTDNRQVTLKQNFNINTSLPLVNGGRGDVNLPNQPTMESCIAAARARFPTGPLGVTTNTTNSSQCWAVPMTSAGPGLNPGAVGWTSAFLQ